MTRRELGIGPTARPRAVEEVRARLLPVEQLAHTGHQAEPCSGQPPRADGARPQRRALGPGGASAHSEPPST
ncbi:hypothetical protein ABZ920_15475 [Streptomyces sp. NPDC046831]|uniref:hypothetical protein n=1 Tax=Streptomyces sp. NPDC046831 TaxID=3154805 RepID=UPI0034003B74